MFSHKNSSRPRADLSISPVPWKDGLNDQQLKAASHMDGPLVVYAGAGSGKTRVIISRIGYLISQGIEARRILAVTFTNKAAREMLARAENLTPLAHSAHIGTFHSVCARWLREFADELGFQSSFSIYDDSDSLSLIKSIIKNNPESFDKSVSPTLYKQAIQQVKTKALTPHDVMSQEKIYGATFPFGGMKLYERYQEQLSLCNAMDFSDLLLNMIILLRHNDRVRDLLSRRYRYIMIDEYQDTNPAQFALISYLINDKQNLFVVGDDDQSIYSWRGATPQNIIDFNEIYHDSKSIRLEQNYRSTKNIIEASNALIAHNKERAPKELFSDIPEGPPLEFFMESDATFEADCVAEMIQGQAQETPYTDIAIFYRTNAQSRLLEDALIRHKIPYKIYGTVRFFERKEIKDLLGYLRLCVNPHDDVSLKRIINTPPRGIGEKTVQKLEIEALASGQSLFQTLKQEVQKNKSSKSNRTSKKMADFLELFQKVEAFAQGDLSLLIEEITRLIEYSEYLENFDPQRFQERQENIHELSAAIAEYHQKNPNGTLSHWMQETLLESDNNGDEGGISLMTLHMAKGLEFDTVYITGCEDGLLPHKNSLEEESKVEEERRLMYVGMTRARRRLTLSCAYKRRIFNKPTQYRMSRFIEEIPSHLIKSSLENAYKRQPFQMQENEFPHEVEVDGLTYSYDSAHLSMSPLGKSCKESIISEGSSVIHKTYGKGKVKNLLEMSYPLRARVQFQHHGMKLVFAHHLELI